MDFQSVIYLFGFVILMASIIKIHQYRNVNTVNKFLFVLFLSQAISFFIWGMYYIVPTALIDVAGSVYDFIPPIVCFATAVIICRENEK